MIKRIYKRLFMLVLCVCMLVGIGMPFTQNAWVQASSVTQETIDISLIESYLTEFSTTYANRIAGSKQEAQTAEYMYNEMLQMQTESLTPAYTPVERNGETEKISFMYENSLGQVLQSYNVWFRKESSTPDAKTLIITCNIDSLSSMYTIEDGQTYEGVHASGSALSAVLSLAYALKDVNLPYHVEFMFFGAGCDGNQGSAQWLRGMTDEDVSAYFLNINIDKIAYGADVFAYTFDQDNAYAKQLKEMFSNNASLTITEFNPTWAVTNEESVAGLPYTHVGLSSDNVNFLQRGILSLHIFRGNYTKDNYTDNLYPSYNDTMEYLAEESNGMYITGIQNIATSILSLMTNDSFYTTFEHAVAPSLTWFTNYNTALYAFVGILAMFVIGCTLYYVFVAMPKAKRAVTTKRELEKLIQNMTQNIVHNVGGKNDNIEVMNEMKRQIHDASISDIQATVHETGAETMEHEADANKHAENIDNGKEESDENADTANKEKDEQ